MHQTLFLSRRNLETLLAKLDRKAAGGQTQCAIIKVCDDPDLEFSQTMSKCMIVAVENEEYYEARGRAAGQMHPLEEDKISKPSTGVALDLGFHRAC